MLDPVFRGVTLENDRLKAVVRDLKFHYDPVGEQAFRLDPGDHDGSTIVVISALQSMLIFKQPGIGGAGNHFYISSMSLVLTQSLLASS